jgi:hypothetical protein
LNLFKIKKGGITKMAQFGDTNIFTWKDIEKICQMGKANNTLSLDRKGLSGWKICNIRRLKTLKLIYMTPLKQSPVKQQLSGLWISAKMENE